MYHGESAVTHGTARRPANRRGAGPRLIRRFLRFGRAALVLRLLTVVSLVGILPAFAPLSAQAAPCDPPVTNPIACENSKPGNPSSEWGLEGDENGDPDLQGFATQMSVNRGETVRFKVKTSATAYRVDIFRLGYYGGLGARKVATIQPSAGPSQTQPACLTQVDTQVIDCGNWAESASWAVPSNATSGIYLARLARENGPVGASHMVFIVRDDAGGSDLVFQTSDTTWQAYNAYGGASLYNGPEGRAFKVSYNRPWNVTGTGGPKQSWLFNAEYPMVRWLEASGYNVSYISGVDTDRRGAELLEHKVFLSVGHDEYWSGAQRANVEAARAAGIHLAFFSANEVFWKMRWENSIDASNTPYRTMVSYKETHANAKIDPEPNVWTGTWRDARFSPPADGGRPENGLTGTIFTVNALRNDAITVPAADGKLRLWRNTSIATLGSGQTATLPAGTLGYEWDEDLDNGFRPAGLFRLSSTSVDNVSYLVDNGSTYARNTANHSLTLYRHGSGALVFGAGTIQWSWGLDNYGRSADTPDPRMQQATVNLFADMGAQPATLQAGLLAATATSDSTPPTSTITAPGNGVTVEAGNAFLITGTAADTGGGRVGGVEVSVDGGTTWRRAEGRESWTYLWQPGPVGTAATIRSRAVDDSGRLETPAPGNTVTSRTRTCPCGIWSNAITPPVVTAKDSNAVELGVKFSSELDGAITGVRFYKGSANTGPHTANLWSSSGTLLASATFTNETASGWQQATFAGAVPITANTTYVVSYHAPVGAYAISDSYFSAGGVSNSPLRALGNVEGGGNGVFTYGAGGFPTSSNRASNYWVDVVYSTEIPPDTTPPTIGGVQATNATTTGATIGWTTNEVADSQVEYGPTAAYGSSTTLDPAMATGHSQVLSGLSASTLYHYRVKSRDAGGNLAASADFTFTTAAPDLTAPTISAVQAGPIGSTRAIVTWTTNEAANTQVEFGQSTAYGSTAPLNPALATSHSQTVTGLTPSALYHYRVLSADASGNLATSADFTFTTAPPDLIAPTISAVAAGPVGSSRVTITWTTNEASDGQVEFGLTTAYGSTTALDPILVTSHSQEVTGLSPTTLYHYRVKSRDWEGNLATSADFTVTTSAIFSIWSDTTAPTVPASSDDTPVELGVKFRADNDGRISGIRFYKGAGNGGVHVGSLWTTTGGLLGSVTFTNETPSGWQQANFAAPVTITAGTTYIASYFGPFGRYAQDENYFSVAGVDSGLLHALKNGVDGENGVFRYGSSGFPNQSFHASNYWVDVVFTPVPTPPTITAVQPSAVGATRAIIGWTTDEAADSQIEYGPTASYGSTTTLDPTRVFGHSQTITGLTASTLYHYRVKSKDAAGNAATSSDFTITTTPPDLSAPAVTAVQASGITYSKATISWTTDEAADTQVEYGLTAAYGSATSLNASMVTGHTQGLTGLQRLTLYHYRVKSRDIEGNLAVSPDFTFVTPDVVCPCSIWDDTATPAQAAADDDQAVEVGLKFRADINGSITGIRFYKGTGNSGTHVGNLWTASGVLLATATFTGETGSGWQQANFSTPVAIAANTTYVVSYHAPVGRYARSLSYFASAGTDNGVLHALRSGVDGLNGVFGYGASGFPTSSSQAANYWVDVVYSTTVPPDSTAPTMSAVQSTAITSSGATITWATNEVADTQVEYGTTTAYGLSTTLNPSFVTSHSQGLSGLSPGTLYHYRVKSKDPTGNLAVSADSTFTTAALDTLPPTISAVQAGGITTSGATITWTTNEIADTQVEYGLTTAYGSSTVLNATLVTSHAQGLSGLSASTVYHFRVKSKDAAGNPAVSTDFTFTTATPGVACPCSIWSSAATPAVPAATDTSAIEVGVKFRSDVNGFITGIRFYKGVGNNGTHVGSLWTATGTKLASATFTNETASGWQQVTFATPVQIAANTTYVASYRAPVGRYSKNENYFATTGTDNGVLHALRSGVDGSNGVFKTGASGFPTSSFKSSNYWVDVVFTP